MSETNKRGYLNEEFKFFHIHDKRAMDFDSHFHDFHKLIICLAGSVTYIIEGKTYKLRPWDILLVPMNKIHHSKTDSVSAYERSVLFIDSFFLEKCGESADLSGCFVLAEREEKHLFHADGDIRREIAHALTGIESSLHSKDFGADFLAKTYFFRLMIFINRLVLDENSMGSALVLDKKLDEVIAYINAHFCEDITIDFLSKKFFISKSYLMHRFKSVTGGSVHSYIIQKRLAAALSMLRDGVPVSVAACECGFGDYTCFYRSFRKAYGFSPGEAQTKN